MANGNIVTRTLNNRTTKMIAAGAGIAAAYMLGGPALGLPAVAALSGNTATVVLASGAALTSVNALRK